MHSVFPRRDKLVNGSIEISWTLGARLVALRASFRRVQKRGTHEAGCDCIDHIAQTRVGLELFRKVVLGIIIKCGDWSRGLQRCRSICNRSIMHVFIDRFVLHDFKQI